MKGISVLIIILGIASPSVAEQFSIPNGDVDALKAAIIASNTNASADTIHLFPYGVYNLNTILGNGAKLVLDTNALDDTRILFLNGCNIRVYDVGFINGCAEYDEDYGGAVYISAGLPTAEVHFYNCLFKGNSAFMGGAIYVSSVNVIIDNCTFTNNDGLFLGGAVTNNSGTVQIIKSVIVNNITTNTSVPGALYNYVALNAPGFLNIYVQGSIIALNTYQNPSQPNHGKEYDLATTSGIYTSGNNLIGSYDNATPGPGPFPFVIGSPSATFDYVGSPVAVIDPLLGTFARHGDYQETYSLLPASFAHIFQAGNRVDTIPAIASVGLVPDTGLEGSELIIYGKNLSDIVSIQFEGAEVISEFTVTDTTLTVTVPADALSGKIGISDSNNATALSDQVFKVDSD